MVERLGLTMRVVRAPQGEVRDALAQDWHAFVASVLPEVQVVPVPNLGEERTVAFARALALDGVILSGGNDLEETPIRDQSEAALLRYALATRRPVVGVCRGLQLLQHILEGPVIPVAGHAGTGHRVELLGTSSDPVQVNSFHDFGVRQGELAQDLRPLALTGDGLVEAADLPGAPVAAVQWHPERPGAPRAWDRKLFRTTFGLEDRP